MLSDVPYWIARHAGGEGVGELLEDPEVLQQQHDKEREADPEWVTERVCRGIGFPEPGFA
jgi:hypothetical protein